MNQPCRRLPRSSRFLLWRPASRVGRAAGGLTRLQLTLACIATTALLLSSSGHAKDLSAAFREASPDAPIVTAPNPDVPSVFDKDLPETLDDLREIETHVRELSERLYPATVCITTGNATGSGVIISEDGWVLTAGHVFENPNRNLTFIFPDGSRARGRSFGHNERIDSGLCKITSDPPEGGWPHVEVGDLSESAPGDYVLAIGHPGGFDEDRPYVVRLGRILQMRTTVLQTDCVVVGGDSGGPLFDMSGRVVGIHSRTNNSVNGNYHIPIDTYLLTWERLTSAERWGGSRSSSGDAQLGVEGEDAPDGGATVLGVVPDSAADDAELQEGDIITSINGRDVDDFDELVRRVGRTSPGDEVQLTILRDGESMTLRVTMGRAGD